MGRLLQGYTASVSKVLVQVFTIGALIIRIGFWGPLYYTYNKETKIFSVILSAPILRFKV